MKRKKSFSQEELRYLKLLAQQYPTVQAASSEIINLQAILNLPKGTEHFISDVHGEYEAFLHILNSCSGVIKEKVDDLFAATISRSDRDELCTLIYYPEEKLEQLHQLLPDMDEWYRITLHRLIEICRWVSSKYTRSKVRKALPKDYAYIIDELLHTHYDEADKRDYYENIINTIIDLGQADRFIEAVSLVIKRMAVDHMHIVGDIFDRGPRADIIMDSLLEYHSVDIQWGNHDILWMGRPAAPAPWWPRCWPIPSITTTWRSSRRDTASPAPPVCVCQRGIPGLRCPPLCGQAHRAGRRPVQREG